MKIVIDIPEEIMEYVKNNGCLSVIYTDEVAKAIINGTPLPKGHGRLIDADALKMDKRVCGDRYLSKTSLFVANKVIEQAPTIIEADKQTIVEVSE